MNIILSYIFFGIGLVFISFAILSLYRFDVFYMRILTSGNADTVGMLFMLTGAICYAESAATMLKIFIIIIISLVTSPLSSHATAWSAYYSGMRYKE